MHIIRSETSIEINSLQRLKISETNLSYQPVKNLLKVQILNEVALRRVVKKRVRFQDRKKENTPKFPSNEI